MCLLGHAFQMCVYASVCLCVCVRVPVFEDVGMRVWAYV